MSKVTRKNSKSHSGNKGPKGSNMAGKRMPRGDKFDAKTATNNPQWYANDAALLRDSASIPFSWAVGTPINLQNPAFTGYAVEQEFAIPGICALYCTPAIGRAESSADPINTAAFRTYSFIRHNNSGSANYDSPDLMLYLLAMSQVYAYLNFLQRAYGLCTTYAQKNRYLPDALLNKMRIDPVDMRNNLASFRYGINALIDKIASMNVPATMAIFARHASLYQNIYIEGTSLKEQLYFYTPQGFWKYTLDDVTFAGKLEYSQFVGDDLWKVRDLLDYGNDMIARLIQSEDMNIMSGDILKAYGDGALIKLTQLPEMYQIVPLPDLAVLQQMKNATVIPITNASRDVVQSANKGWLEFKPECMANETDHPVFDSMDEVLVANIWRTYEEKRLLTVTSSEPTPEEVMESTRLMNICELDNEKSDLVHTVLKVYPGTEIVTAVRYAFSTTPDVGWDELDTAGPNYVVPIKLNARESTDASLWIQSVLASFKFHPAHHFVGFYYDESDDACYISQHMLNFDVDNYAIMDRDMLARMHETALLSMLNVPSLVKV